MVDDGKISITLLEDNELYAIFITEKLKENFNCQVTVNKSLEEFFQNIGISKTDIFILDYSVPGGNGIEAIKALQKQKIEAEILILSSQSEMQITINALKTGAFDYIIKNNETIERLVSSINKALKIQTLKKENITLKVRINKYKTLIGIILFVFVCWVSLVVFSIGA
jgi:DNA-binding NarL/FixJ family response regulator